jgi:hypothetical protein
MNLLTEGIWLFGLNKRRLLHFAEESCPSDRSAAEWRNLLFCGICQEDDLEDTPHLVPRANTLVARQDIDAHTRNSKKEKEHQANQHRDEL